MSGDRQMSMLQRFLEPMKNRILMLIGRAIVKAVNDTKTLQRLQVSAFDDEVLEDVERYQDYGITSNPPKDTSEAILACLGGNRQSAVIIKVDNRTYRLKGLAEGELALYTDEGDKIHFKRGHIIEATTQKWRINMNTLKMQNSSNELISVLIQLVDEIIAARTFTDLGPEPLIGLNQTFPVIKSKLETFRE